jgi:hypothetical protein
MGRSNDVRRMNAVVVRSEKKVRKRLSVLCYNNHNNFFVGIAALSIYSTALYPFLQCYCWCLLALVIYPFKAFTLLVAQVLALVLNFQQGEQVEIPSLNFSSGCQGYYRNT